MPEFKRTDQYAVTCKGSSRPYVQETRLNEENPDYLDLLLGGGTQLSNNSEDYTVKINGVELQIIKIAGKTLTVKL